MQVKACGIGPVTEWPLCKSGNYHLSSANETSCGHVTLLPPASGFSVMMPMLTSLHLLPHPIPFSPLLSDLRGWPLCAVSVRSLVHSVGLGQWETLTWCWREGADWDLGFYSSAPCQATCEPWLILHVKATAPVRGHLLQPYFALSRLQ